MVYTYSYEFTNPGCSMNTRPQSPINLPLSDSLYYDEKYFRFLTNNYEPISKNTSWVVFADERAIGFTPSSVQKSFGSFVFVKDWAMYSFNLQKILFRVRSEHAIDGSVFDAEMQLVHSLDSNYYPPGRRIDLGVNYLVVSVMFKVTEDTNPAVSQLFNFMGLSGYANGTSSTIQKDIKLHHIIQHQPSYLYQGSLTYQGCDPALWLVFANYHYISRTDYNNLKKMIQIPKANTAVIADTITQSNVRDLQINVNLPVYRNWKDESGMQARPTLMTYNSASFTTVSLAFTFTMLLLSLFF